MKLTQPQDADSNTIESERWHWKMDYCKTRKRHPGEKVNWDKAEAAYQEALKVAAKAKPEASNPFPYKFRAGDIVHHGPTGDDWMLACDEENGEVMPCGWTAMIAKASDCKIETPASDYNRLEMLKSWSKRTETGEWMDQRSTLARHQLAKMKQTEAPTPPTGTMETIIQEILQHDKDHPDHGIGCSCMDKHAVSLRRLLNENGMYDKNESGYMIASKSMMNLLTVFGHIIRNP